MHPPVNPPVDPVTDAYEQHRDKSLQAYISWKKSRIVLMKEPSIARQCIELILKALIVDNYTIFKTYKFSSNRFKKLRDHGFFEKDMEPPFGASMCHHLIKTKTTLLASHHSDIEKIIKLGNDSIHGTVPTTDADIEFTEKKLYEVANWFFKLKIDQNWEKQADKEISKTSHESLVNQIAQYLKKYFDEVEQNKNEVEDAENILLKINDILLTLNKISDDIVEKTAINIKSTAAEHTAIVVHGLEKSTTKIISSIENNKQSVWKKVYDMHKRHPLYWLITIPIVLFSIWSAKYFISKNSQDKTTAIEKDYQDLPEEKKEKVLAFFDEARRKYPFDGKQQREIDSLLLNGQIDQVEELVEIAQQHEKATKENDASFNFQIALLKTLQYKFQDALPLYKKALELSPENTLYMNGLGVEYSLLGKPDTAIDYFQKAMDINKKVHGENDTDLVMSYSCLGIVWGQLREFSTAIDYSQKALDIDLKDFKNDSAKLANGYNNLGLSLSISGRFIKGEEYFQKALDLTSYNDPNRATIYNNLSGIYFNWGEYEKATESLQKALCVFKINCKDEMHPQIAHTYSTLGGVCLHFKHYKEAINYYEKAIDIKSKIFGEYNTQSMHDYDNISFAWHSLKNTPKAKEYLEKELEISKNKFGADDSITKDIQRLIDEVKSNS